MDLLQAELVSLSTEAKKKGIENVKEASISRASSRLALATNPPVTLTNSNLTLSDTIRRLLKNYFST